MSRSVDGSRAIPRTAAAVQTRRLFHRRLLAKQPGAATPEIGGGPIPLPAYRKPGRPRRRCTRRTRSRCRLPRRVPHLRNDGEQKAAPLLRHNTGRTQLRQRVAATVVLHPVLPARWCRRLLLWDAPRLLPIAVATALLTPRCRNRQTTSLTFQLSLLCSVSLLLVHSSTRPLINSSTHQLPAPRVP